MTFNKVEDRLVTMWAGRDTLTIVFLNNSFILLATEKEEKSKEELKKETVLGKIHSHCWRQMSKEPRKHTCLREDMQEHIISGSECYQTVQELLTVICFPLLCAKGFYVRDVP